MMIGLPATVNPGETKPSGPEKLPSWKMNTRAPNEAVIDSRVMITALIGMTTEPNSRNRMIALAPRVSPIAYGTVAAWLAMKSEPSAARPPTWVVTPSIGDRAHGRHDRGPVRAERGERADRIEPDGRVAQVGRLEALEPGRELRRQLLARGGEQGRDAGRVELGAGGRIAQVGERPLDPVDAIERHRSAAARSRMRWTLASSVGLPSTAARTMIGEVSPARKSRDRATAASRLSMPGGRIEASGMPCSRRRNGVPRMSRKASVGMSTMTGRAITQWAMRSQRDSRAAAASAPVGRPKTPPDPIAQAGHAAGVDPWAEHAEDGRQEGQGVEHRGGHRQRAADAERAQGGRLEQEQAGQPDGNGQPGERDGLAARRDGDLDGRGDVAAAPQLLAESADHEQRVVDGEGEAEHRRHVLDVDRQLRDLGRDVHAGERRRDGQDGDDEGHAGRHERGEDEDEDERGERQRDGLGLEELLLRLLGLVLGGRRHAGQEQGRAGGLVDELAELVHLVDGRLVGDAELDDDVRGRAVGADEPVVGRLRPADRPVDAVVGDQPVERVGDGGLERLGPGVVPGLALEDGHDRAAGGPELVLQLLPTQRRTRSRGRSSRRRSASR